MDLFAGLTSGTTAGSMHTPCLMTLLLGFCIGSHQLMHTEPPMHCLPWFPLLDVPIYASAAGSSAAPYTTPSPTMQLQPHSSFAADGTSAPFVYTTGEGGGGVLLL
jgi:hypothetical protein